MTFLTWFILALGGIGVTTVNVIFAPLIALFIGSNGYLPQELSWFQTPDNPAIGDTAFHQREMSWTKSEYLYGVFWALRNPAYGYDHRMGAKIVEGCVYSTNNLSGVEWVKPNIFVSGTQIQKMTCGSKTYFEWRIAEQLTSGHYFKASFGWRLYPPLVVGQVRNLTVTISPWMKMID